MREHVKRFKWTRRIIIALAGLAIIVALFYAEEDWRGKRAWENCKRELEAKGETLNWNAYIPPRVPNDKNFFKAPKMAEWFVGRGESDLSKRMENPKSGWFGASDQITNQIQAREYLAWSDKFEPDFDLIRVALKRPDARIDGDYAHPVEMPVPNFITVRTVAQTLAQRAHCYYLLNQPEQALKELTLVHGICRLLEGKPMTLVSAMINVAVMGLYAEIVTEGFQKKIWKASQLAVLQEQLKGVNLATFMVEAFRSERAAECHDFETMPWGGISGLFAHGRYLGDNLTFRIFLLRLKNSLSLDPENGPRGWVYQNLVVIANLHQEVIDGFDLTHHLMIPQKINNAQHELKRLEKHNGPYTFLAAIAIPDWAEACQTMAYNQTMLDETRIACALERYRTVHGEYPEMLDALVPQFIKKLSHDIIGGRPLHYHRMADGKFLLYSIGWNEVDDGGQESPSNQDGEIDYTKGDWVWGTQP